MCHFMNLININVSVKINIKSNQNNDRVHYLQLRIFESNCILKKVK